MPRPKGKRVQIGRGRSGGPSFSYDVVVVELGEWHSKSEGKECACLDRWLWLTMKDSDALADGTAATKTGWEGTT